MATCPPTLWSPLYWIADPSLTGARSLEEWAREAIAAGLRLFQYREKQLSQQARYPQALALTAMAREADAVFLINDNIDLALAVDADGVHLGHEDFPVRAARKILGAEKIIGCSAHTLELAKAAEADGADYLGVGPIFPSPTKMTRPPLGCGALADVCRAVRIPVYAIGGITVDRCEAVLAAGAHGVAVASALVRGPIGAQTRSFLAALRAARPHSPA